MAKQIEDGMSPFQRAIEEGLTNPTSNPKTKRPGRPTQSKELEWVGPFLDAIAEGLSIDNATKAAEVHPTTVYQRRRENVGFRGAWDKAAEVGTRLLEQEAARRAYHGTDEPVFHQGAQCGVIRKYSDTLMIFLLKARRPDKYRDGVEGGGHGSTVVNITVETKEKRDDPKLVESVPIEAVTVGDGDKQDGAGVGQAAPVP